MGPPRSLAVSKLCENVIFVGTPLKEDGSRDVLGSVLTFSVGAHLQPPPTSNVATRGLLLTAQKVSGHHHVTLT